MAALFSVSLNLPQAWSQPCIIDASNVHQHIDGFGASSAFSGFTWTSAMANMFFSTNSGTGMSLDGTNFPYTGIGLSLLRNQIQPASTTNGVCTANANEIALMQMAQTLGAKVWSTPWTPPTFCKNVNTQNGGNYDGIGGNSTNLLYAKQLAGYVATMKKTYNVNIYAISIQNEPDVSTTYPSCLWTAQQYHDFVTNLYPAMVASNVSSTLIMLPEDEHWSTNYYALAMSDPAVAADVGIVADHNYDGPDGPGDLVISNYGKPLWETEVSTFDAFDGSITNAIYWAGRIHLFMTVAQVNAYHFWWLINLNTDNEGLTDNNYVPAKRMYALGNFSRFVRPGYYRIDATNPTDALISAYKDSNSLNFAIVAVNPDTNAIAQTFDLTNFTAHTLTPWLTTSNLSLVATNAVNLTNNSFTYSLPPLSIVTFAGQQVVATSNGPPTLAPISNQKINPGVSLSLTNSATDTNTPPPTLSFSLAKGPTNATLSTINSSNAVFAWRPLLSQANTTNPVSVVVTATGGGQVLSATNNFTVTVNPVTNPVVNTVTISNRQVRLVVNGQQGPDYTLLTSTNLTKGWSVLYKTNSPPTPVTLTDTNSTNAERFYRIQIGP